jgi:acyl-CoA synthetase (AMP-forming)/AMP-acid ligase II
MVVPDRTALVCGDQRVTFVEMADHVNRLANHLQALDAGPDKPVGVMSVNGIEYIEAYYAAAKIGATFVPLNYRAKHEELTYMINTSDIHVLFVGQRYLDLLANLRPDLEKVQHFVCFDTPAEGMASSPDVLAKASPEEPFVEVD